MLGFSVFPIFSYFKKLYHHPSSAQVTVLTLSSIFLFPSFSTSIASTKLCAWIMSQICLPLSISAANSSHQFSLELVGKQFNSFLFFHFLSFLNPFSTKHPQGSFLKKLLALFLLQIFQWVHIGFRIKPSLLIPLYTAPCDLIPASLADLILPFSSITMF